MSLSASELMSEIRWLKTRTECIWLSRERERECSFAGLFPALGNVYTREVPQTVGPSTVNTLFLC